MGFASGSVSFRRFAVVGNGRRCRRSKSMLEKLAEHALRPAELGMPEDVEYGWSGGRHVLDGEFSFENNVYADALNFALRIDTNKVPADLKKAYQIMEEEAAAASNPSGFISKNQKRDARETVRRKIEEDLRTGKFRRSKLLPILWDMPAAGALQPGFGRVFEKLAEIFERTFGLSLVPLTAGALALRLLEPRGKRRDYEDLRPTRFVPGPGGEGEWPEYPWVAKGPEPKDFLGNEFLLWLWHEADARNGSVPTDEGEVTVSFDRSLDLDCAYGQTGRDSLRGDGPTRMPEARDALRSGKVPRQAGLVMDVVVGSVQPWARRRGVGSGLGEAAGSGEADTPRVLFEERIALRDLSKTLDGLFETFLKFAPPRPGKDTSAPSAAGSKPPPNPSPLRKDREGGTRRHGDAETRRRGDTGTRGRGKGCSGSTFGP